MTTLVPISVALLGGIAICLQSQFSGTIGESLGIMESAFIIHLGGLLLAGVIMVFMGGGTLSAWRSLSWYTLSAGFVGVLIIATISYAVPRLGLGTTLTLSIVAQLVLGALLDHFGLLGAIHRPLDVSRAIGMAVLFLGTWLIVR